MINVIFFGYREWALKVARNLANSHYPGWKIKDIVSNSNAFHDINIDLFRNQPEGTIFLFCGWSWKIPKEIYEKYTCLIMHASPLPKYRGGSPLQHQIMNGEKEGAVTICKASEKYDTGAIYGSRKLSLEGEMRQIMYQLAEQGTLVALQVLDDIFFKKIKPVPQDESQATTYKRRTPEESEITMEDLKTKSADELANFIRALGDPYPNAYIVCKNGEKLYLTGARV